MANKSFIDSTDIHFQVFAASLERLLAGYDEVPKKNRFEHQRTQMGALVNAEKTFRQHMIRHRWGEKVYQGFLTYIHDERRNVLAARPFFRERAETFKEFISPALAARNFKGLYRFAINGMFIQWMLARYPKLFGKKSQVRRWADESLRIREEMIEQNMPLAISRAKIFRGRTPPSPHMDFMDANQVAAEGLISAVDKYCGVFSTNFRAVIIGRAVGNLISNYSEPMLHFYPGDRRKIYRANKARRRTQDLQKIVESVNDGLPEVMKTNTDEIQQLLNASSHISLDQGVATPDGVNDKVSYADCTIDEKARPDELVEHKSNAETLMKGLAALTVVKRKVLALVGMASEV